MRFPKFPPDILARADAMLAAKYGTLEPIDPVLVEVACEAMMVERERLLAVVEEVRVSPEWSGRGADGVCGAIVEWQK